MYIIFPYGDLQIHGVIITATIDFYNSALRLNQVMA